MKTKLPTQQKSKSQAKKSLAIIGGKYDYSTVEANIYLLAWEDCYKWIKKEIGDGK